MTREQRTAEVIAKTFDSKITELKQRIEFQKEQLASEKRWLKNEEEKGTNQNYIQMGLDSIIAKETEVEMLETFIEMYNSLVDSINEYIDKHPELQNEPTMSFAEFKALAFDIIGKYNNEWRVHLDFTRTGKAKVAIQFHRPGYVPGEDGRDFKPMKKTKDDWYDDYSITTPAEALEKVLYKNKEELLGSLKKAVEISCQLEKMAIRRSKEA